MFGIKGDSPDRAGTLLPPATTRRLPDRPAASTREARIAPPFIPSAPHAQPPAEPAAASEPMRATAPSEESAIAPEPREPEVAQPASEPELGAETAEGEGVVEPAFTADTDAVLEELTRHADDVRRKEEFPLDAFIVPEQSHHVPTGLEGAPATPPPEHTPANTLAERLEKLSHRLRVEESDAIVRRLAGGDRLDTLLAGLLAGYLAGKSEQR